jgi:hypothetical protein
MGKGGWGAIERRQRKYSHVNAAHLNSGAILLATVLATASAITSALAGV